VKDSIAALDVQDVIIDGEIVALDEKGPLILPVTSSTRYGPGTATNSFLRL
jgi:ATP-dependent DNA ligase